MADVLFINMPWSGASIPSLGVALLTAVLREQDGIEADTWYGNLHFSDILYRELGDSDELARVAGSRKALARFCRQEQETRDLVDEYLFASAGRPDDENYWALFAEHPASREAMPLWKAAQSLVSRFLDEALVEVLRRDCSVVGFTSMFGQNMASLRLAERIKEERPDIKVLFGGANCEGVMGAALLRNFPQIDVVCSGEAERSAPAVIRRLLAGDDDGKGIPGVLWRDKTGTCHYNPQPASFDELDELPFPDYSAYYRTLEELGYEDAVKPTVFLEQSRGCWWGQKHHCTFCGLNSQGMNYRKKSDDRCFDELVEFTRAYPSKVVHFADNILDMKKFGGFMKRVADADLGLDLFFEIKSNVSKERMRSLADAGVYSVQPGIENLSDRVLKEMRKGVSGLQNIQCLKWARQYGIEAIWNLLYGFPGETAEDFERNLDLMKSITHLERNERVEKIVMQRFSPNFDQAGELGFANVRPQKAYRFIYDLPDDELMNICYAFDYDYINARDTDKALAELRAFSDEWAAQEDPGSVTYMDLEDGGAIVLDTRFNMPRNVLRLNPAQNQLIRFLDQLRGKRQLEAFAVEHGWVFDDLLSYLGSLEDQRLVVSSGERYLGVIPLPDCAVGISSRAA